MSYLGRSAKLSLKAQEKVSFLATAGQTVKTGLSYVPSFVEVYVNGILLTDTTDFTAVNGSSITFTVALALNDEVTVISLKTFSVSDHYTKTEDDALLAAKATNTAVAAKAPIASPSFTGNVNVAGEQLKLTGSSSQTYVAALNTGSGEAGFYMDAANGDLSGSDYAWIKQKNNLDVEIGSASLTNRHILFSPDGSEKMRIAANGIVTKPFQPIVSMSRSEGALNLSSNANVFATTSITTWALQGITHNTSNGRFTLPVTGKYRVSFYSIKNGSVTTYIDLQKNGGHYGFRIFNNATPSGWQQYSGTGVYSFAANDYLTLINVTGGTNNAHGGTHMNFSIELIG